MKFETKAIRNIIDRTHYREHSSALFPTSSFVFDDPEQMRALFADEIEGNIYSRFSNPSVREFEQKMASLEGTEDAIATASGMAAVYASFVSFLSQGDHIVACRSVFGSTFNILAQSLPEMGITCTFVDALEVDSWDAAVQTNTKMFYLESPSNPGLDIIDLEIVGQFCKKHKILFNIDNCFATPYLQNPIQYGADLIVHSATKFIDGQGRVLGGLIAGSKEHIQKVMKHIRHTGPTLSPFNAWILSKSLETLAVRMDRHCSNAFQLALWLQDQPQVVKVNYPFLESHPQYTIACKQMSQGGGIVTFEIKGGLEGGTRFLSNLKMLSLTANLGDCKSIASHPASTTHYKVPVEERLKMKITDGLIRISVGLEHIDDIIGDIEQAMKG